MTHPSPDIAKRLYEALRGAYALSFGYAATYQYQHKLERFHPVHAQSLAKQSSALAAYEQSLKESSNG